jgi:DNA-binding MarR family transcriptional regulator
MVAVDPPQRLRRPHVLGDLLIYRLGRLYATAGAMTLRVCEGEFGIPRREWRLLAVLGETGELQPSDLATRAELDRARTSRALAGLQTKGLVERQAVASDRRLARVALTAQGRDLHARMLPRVAAINGALLAGLGDDSVAQLDVLLEALQRRALQLLEASAWPKADRRLGGSRRLKVPAAGRKR